MYSKCVLYYLYRVICDKSSNKSKIAFCEYKDPEMAVRAIHSLNGYEFKGQPIHVDLATSEKCRQEIESNVFFFFHLVSF